jgi:hypothetical protein
MIDMAGATYGCSLMIESTAGTADVRGRQTRLAGAVALLALASLIALAWALQRPPAPAPASAPATAFSAERAYADLQRMAGPEPTPIGSVAGDAVRDYLVSALSTAGLSVEVQKGLGSRIFGGVTAAGLVDNVVATVPGYASTGQVVLAAHYDTTFGTPGAADDKSSVAAMLETARALGGKPLRNDLVMIFTDGEEAGLLGASSFVAERRPMNDQGGVVLNWEATGNVGPSVLFETSSGNAELIKEYATAAPYPMGDSALAALYQAGNQNSDFTPFHEAGFVGLNFALMDGTAAYHHSGDTAERLDRAGLQHMGANMLGLTRALGARDLAGLRSSDDAVFFSAFGQLMTYPMWLVWPLAGLSVAILTALAVLARRRGEATIPRLLAGAAAALLPIVVAPLAAIALWQVLVAIRPGYATLFMGDPYRPHFYRWALVALTVMILLTWYVALRRRIGPASLAIGALVWPTVLGVVTAWLLPAMSYYGSLAATAAGGGTLIALLLRERRPVWSVVALAAGAVPGVLLFVQGGRAMVGVLGIANGAVAVFFFVLAGLIVLPLVELVLPISAGVDAAQSITRRPSLLVPLGALIITVVLITSGLAVDRFDPNHPRQTHLMYAMDADRGTAMWASQDQDPDAWTAAYVPNANGDSEPPIPLPYGTKPKWLGTAAVLPVDAPRIDLLEARSDRDVPTVRVRIASSRAADVVNIFADRQVESATITADGQRPVTAKPSYPQDDGPRPWPYELIFYNPPAAGFVLTLQLRGTDLPRIYVSDYTVGLDELPGFRPRPAGLVRSPAHSSDIVVVGRTFSP